MSTTLLEVWRHWWAGIPCWLFTRKWLATLEECRLNLGIFLRNWSFKIHFLCISLVHVGPSTSLWLVLLSLLKMIYCEYRWLWLEMNSFWNKRNLDCYLGQVRSVRLNILAFIWDESQVHLTLSSVFPQWAWMPVTQRTLHR